VIPNGVKEGDESVNVFVVNCNRSHQTACQKEVNKLTRDTMSTRSPAEFHPYSLNSAGEDTPKYLTNEWAR